MPKSLPVIRSHWRKSDKIYKVLQISRATDEVVLLELDTQKKYKERFATFYFAFEQVFKIGDVAKWLNRSPRSIYRYEAQGQIEKQKTYQTGGKKQLRFYSLDDVFHMHEMISVIHQGKPRRDGRATNNTMPDIGTLKLELKERYRYDR